MIFWKLRLCRSCHPRGRGWNCRFLGIEFLKICLIGRNVYVFINQKKGLNPSPLLYTVYNEEFLIEKSGGGNVRIYTKDKKTVKKHTKNMLSSSELLVSLRAIRSSRSFLKIDESNSIFSIIFTDRLERFDHGRSFIKIAKVIRLKIEISKDRIPNPDKRWSNQICVVYTTVSIKRKTENV